MMPLRAVLGGLLLTGLAFQCWTVAADAEGQDAEYIVPDVPVDIESLFELVVQDPPGTKPVAGTGRGVSSGRDHAGRGHALFGSDPAEAARHYRAALRIDPSLSYALKYLALALKSTGDTVGSRRAWALALYRGGSDGSGVDDESSPLDVSIAVRAIKEWERSGGERPRAGKGLFSGTGRGGSGRTGVGGIDRSMRRKELNERFAQVYERRTWVSGSDDYPASGMGSLLSTTEAVRQGLEMILAKFNPPAKSMLDIGCGDMTWMPSLAGVRDGTIAYHGIDVVPSLIEGNEERLADRANMRFSVLDTVADPLPGPYDAVLIKDVMIHLPLDDIVSMLLHVSRSSSRVLFAMHDPTLEENSDETANALHFPAGYRRVNLELPPFSLGKPAMWFHARTASDDPSVIGAWPLPLKGLEERARHGQQQSPSESSEKKKNEKEKNNDKGQKKEKRGKKKGKGKKKGMGMMEGAEKEAKKEKSDGKQGGDGSRNAVADRRTDAKNEL